MYQNYHIRYILNINMNIFRQNDRGQSPTALKEGTEKVLFCLIMKFPKNLIPNYHRFPISKWGNSVYFTTNYKLEVGMEFSGISFALNFTDFFSGLRFSGEEAPRHARGFAERLERKSTSKFNIAKKQKRR